MKRSLLTLVATTILIVPAARAASPVSQVDTVGGFAIKVTTAPISRVGAALLAVITGNTATAISPQDVIPVPTQCLLLKNHGACVECCKAATNCEANDPFACNACSHFCMNNVPPPPSDPEPQP